MDTVVELFEKIMAAKSWNKKQLAKFMGIDSSILSQKLGTEWNHHWRVFMRLLPVMLELKMITEEGKWATSDNDRNPKGEGMEPNSLKSQDNSMENGPSITPIMSTLVSGSLLLQ